MKKFLSINASNQVIKHWQNEGYTIVFVFTPNAIKTLKPELSKNTCSQILDPELKGAA